MRLATFSDDKAARIGVVIGDEIVDLQAAAPDLPRDMIALLSAGESALDIARRAIESGPRKRLTDVKLHAPIPRPTELMIIGANYKEHTKEGLNVKGLPVGLDQVLKERAKHQELPILVNKQVSCVVGPADPIYMPRVSDQLDYECELGFVIGRECRHVSRELAHKVIAGYLIVNDVSVRDWQFKSTTHTLGKSFDTCGPTGPWIVTPDEIGDPHNLSIKTWVNGELLQDGRTDDMVFDCYDLVAVLSKAFTLLPGMIISTGTCEGVGVALDPPRFLKVGDVVKLEIENIGTLQNTIIDEPASLVFVG